MKANMADAGYHPLILSSKYGQTGNVKLLTTKARFSAFVIRWPNLDLKVSPIS